MYDISSTYLLGVAIVLSLITIIGIYSGSKVKSSKDFISGAHKASAGIVSGSLLGTLIGGASTIGTAQLAFTYGFSAWWFTLGAGLGCLVLGVFFVKPLYNSGVSTLPQIFAKEYGQRSAFIATILSSLGGLLSIIAQFLSGIALIRSISNIGMLPSALIIVALMLVYVMFGGIWGTGLVGVVKIMLLFSLVGVCGFIAVSAAGGLTTITDSLPSDKYFNLFARGVSIDGGAGLSLILGVVSTQSYIQAVVSAKSVRESRNGALLSAFLAPLIGIASIMVGLYMRLSSPNMSPAQALPAFIVAHTPPVVAGMLMATLLITLVGTGAGIALGTSSMLYNSVYKIYINKNATDKKSLLFTRLMITVILVGAAIFSSGKLGTLILGWSFMSMGLRGAVVFVPLCSAIYLKGRVHIQSAELAMIAGPLFVLIGKFLLPPAIDPLFPGVGIAAVIVIADSIFGRKKTVDHNII